jgi:hypothetical protein
MDEAPNPQQQPPEADDEIYGVSQPIEPRRGSDLVEHYMRKAEVQHNIVA